MHRLWIMRQRMSRQCNQLQLNDSLAREIHEICENEKNEIDCY